MNTLLTSRSDSESWPAASPVIHLQFIYIWLIELGFWEIYLQNYPFRVGLLLLY